MKLLLTVGALFLTGCMSTKIIFSERFDASVKPAYTDFFDYYFYGLSGHPTLNLQKICMDQKPYALQRVRSPEDQVITFFTLGIYTPMTVKVWCGD